ncbi:putative phiE125 gp8 family phage protein [Palleronia aestuarii]|uniref:Putative phiE125 gp8 family phage protein n=1 Tax=Palleronia aestuarii TaxID=568105 RepID=A0A2W7NM39_9RHOB|nr:hypothetical protein [Palleronia aestuarii]PZX17714.1 putative phiE125 gp8 family phage protein [Palleronia aestuarii]
MFLVEQTGIPASELPLPQFRTHLRLGSGFSDDTIQNAVLESALRAAMTQIEGQCAKAILIRNFLWTLGAWRDLSRQTLPRAPVIDVNELAIVNLDGTREVIAPNRYTLVRDTHRPAIVARGFMLPQIPIGGHAEIGFRAGYGANWREVPSDLGLAVLSLAAAQYEDRVASGALPPGVSAILSTYRQPRMFGGF